MCPKVRLALGSATVADQSTFADQAMEYAPQLYSAALRMTRNQADAERPLPSGGVEVMGWTGTRMAPLIEPARVRPARGEVAVEAEPPPRRPAQKHDVQNKKRDQGIKQLPQAAFYV